MTFNQKIKIMNNMLRHQSKSRPQSGNKNTVFITGGAGYVGAMLCDQFSKLDYVEKIIALDMEERPELLEGNDKVVWIKANTSDETWQEEVAKHNPNIVIHTAWQIREMYGDRRTQYLWNVLGSKNIFDFAFSIPAVERLIYFSTASSYGAKKENTIEHMFKENEPFREIEYSYGNEKRIVEELLEDTYKEKKEHGKAPQVFIVRPAAITGPRGRFMRIRFGLQSALSGQLKDSFVYKMVSFLVATVPATKKWCRQFIHEDDVTDIISLLSFKDLDGEYEVFNITPPGKVVGPHDMGKAVGKRVVIIPPFVIRIAFFFFWHLTRGKIPTSRGGWRFYSYPVVLDGTRLTEKYGYQYKHKSFEAFYHTKGRYEKYVPEESRR